MISRLSAILILVMIVLGCQANSDKRFSISELDSNVASRYLGLPLDSLLCDVKDSVVRLSLIDEPGWRLQFVDVIYARGYRLTVRLAEIKYQEPIDTNLRWKPELIGKETVTDIELFLNGKRLFLVTS